MNNFWDTRKVDDADFVDEFRKHLASDGAVTFFEEKSDSDLAADRATAGLYPGTPGTGLYKKGSHYEAQCENRWACYGGRFYSSLTADEWRDYLSSREPRAIYIRHWQRRGTSPAHDGLYYDHVIIEFKIKRPTHEP